MTKFRALGAVAIFVLFTAGHGLCQCPALNTKSVDINQPSPAIELPLLGTSSINGTVADAKGNPVAVGSVTVCVNNTAVGIPQTVGPKGNFSVTAAVPLAAGDIIAAQYDSGVAGVNPGPVQTLPLMSCAKNIPAGTPATVSLTIDAEHGTYKGSVPGQTSGNIIICIHDQPVAAPAGTAGVLSTGSFSGSGLKLSDKDSVIAEYSKGVGPPYTNWSPPTPISLSAGQSPTFSRASPLGMAVVGLDISGASSTAPQAVFLATGIMDIPVIDASNGITDFSKKNTFWLSGMLRIAGMAQPGTLSGNLGDLASTGTYLSSAINATPDKIVQSVEADATLAYQIWSWEPHVGSFDVGTFTPTPDRPQATTLFTFSALLGSVGAITPLSASQANPPVYYLTQQIMKTYNIDPAGCSYASVTPPCYVAFVPSDRTHFYRNYEVGARIKIYAGDYADATHPQYRFPGMADILVGQNEYVTGGRLHGAVLHIGGTMPVPTVDGVYIFGSMDLGMNFKYSQDNPQLLLTPVPSSANLTYLSSSVNTISVPQQPNRDRYRLGFGVDIFHLVTALKAKMATKTQ